MAEPVRVQLRRTKGWRKPPNTVVVARPSQWGNPARVGDDLSYHLGDGAAVASADQVMTFYRAHAEAEIAASREEWIAPLRGKNLACWCALDQPCHADILLVLAN